MELRANLGPPLQTNSLLTTMNSSQSEVYDDSRYDEKREKVVSLGGKVKFFMISSVLSVHHLLAVLDFSTDSNMPGFFSDGWFNAGFTYSEYKSV